MSQQLANHLKSYGRDGDTELVHMSKGEVKGLQDLAMAAGGSLTVNPDTGLVEAGFLKNMLPMIAGIGLNALFPGSGALIGLGVGGFEAARTGDIGKGLLAGLGAYGGAGLGSAMGIGAASAAPAATTAGTGLSTAGGAGAGSAVTPTATGGLGAAPTNFGLSTAAPSATSSFGSLAAPTTAPTITSAAPSMAPSQIAKYGFAAAAPVLNDALTPPGINPITPEKSSGKYLSSDFKAYVPNQPDPYYRPMGLGYAVGGQVDPLEQMAPGGLAAIQGMRDGYSARQTVDGNIPQMADGGSIGGYSDGGRMLKGPGDGMSDDIPATIGGKQPARLADGEFVVPADVVSHLGNGSTDAGAKRLYGMMDKVRKARTGTKKQGKQIKPEKYMPA